MRALDGRAIPSMSERTAIKSRVRVLTIVIVVAALALPLPAAARFSATTQNAGNSIQAHADFHTPVLDQSASTAATRVNSVTLALAVTGGYANQAVVVGVSLDASHTVTGVTYAGAALTFIGAQNDSGSKTRVELWYRVAPQTGTNNVVVTFSGTTNDDVVVGASSWRGVHQTTPLGTLARASGKSSTASVIVSSATHEAVVDVVAADSKSVTAQAGQTQLWSRQLDKVGGGGSYRPGAASVTMSWMVNNGGNDWAIAAVPLKPATP
jgi:hypothetical protein